MLLTCVGKALLSGEDPLATPWAIPHDHDAHGHGGHGHGTEELEETPYEDGIVATVGDSLLFQYAFDHTVNWMPDEERYARRHAE